MKLKKRILSLALAGTMALGLMPGMSMTALAADGDTSYTLTIPSTLNVANSGWNATSGTSAMGTLADGKKLTVTASSGNSWALKSGENSVGYNLATATGTYISTAQPASWEFTELSSTATTKPMGIIVNDYSSKPAGTYQDTVTFTAVVENAGPVAGDVESVKMGDYDCAKVYTSATTGFYIMCTDYGKANWATAVSYSVSAGGNTFTCGTKEEWEAITTACGGAGYNCINTKCSGVAGWSNISSYTYSSTEFQGAGTWYLGATQFYTYTNKNPQLNVRLISAF